MGNRPSKQTSSNPKASKEPPFKAAAKPLFQVSTAAQAKTYELPDSLKHKNDFGTCFTGFSVLPIPQDGSLPELVLTEQNWPDQPPRVASPKCPTALNFYVSPDEIDAQDWGWSVDAAFPDPQIKKFDRVKLYLGSLSSDSQKKNNELLGGLNELPEGLTPQILIAQYLQGLKPFIDSMIGRHINQTRTDIDNDYRMISPSEIMYSMTIPIEWNEMQVNVMRAAAFDAGYIESLNSDNFLLCHEPVAAAFALVKKFERVLVQDSTALVVDAGGGTVDLFMCKLGPNHELNEITKASGDFFGGAMVDTVFWAFVQRKLGPACYEALFSSANLRTCYRDISHKWDAMKREFTPLETAWKPRRDGSAAYKPISLTAYAMEHFSNLQPKPQLDGYGEIRITLLDMQHFFDPVIRSIQALISEQLDEGGFNHTRKLDYLFLVGGFSCSPYLFDIVSGDINIRARVKHIPKVDTPDGVVLEGAAWFAWGYRSLKQRISTKSLGIRGCRKFKRSDDLYDQIINPTSAPNIWLVNKKFIPFVEKNDIIYQESSFTTPALTCLEHGFSTIEVYKTLGETPLDITGECIRIGKVSIDTDSLQSLTGLNWTRFKATIEYSQIENWVIVRPIVENAHEFTEEDWKMIQIKVPLYQGISLGNQA